jgi:transcriptional regulator with AAA-type ATPase domain
LRIPTPAAMLVEHPAVPIPRIVEGPYESDIEGDRVTARVLSRKHRLGAALQLTAAASLLAEFDLWPGKAAIRDARFVRTPEGVSVQLARYPVPMSRVFSRLGGGEAAAVATRTALISAISEAVNLPVASIDASKGEPGFFLEAALSRQLRDLKRPLDRSVARALWAFRWDGLPIPTAGAIDYWQVPSPELARRLAGGLWAEISRRRGHARLWAAGNDFGRSVAPPPVGGRGTLILVGEASADELASVSRWVKGERCSAVVVGRFPSGWHPPRPPCFDPQIPFRHLAVAGVPLEEARRFVEQRTNRFDPFDRVDRGSLTDAARTVYESIGDAGSDFGSKPRTNKVAQVLALSPDGLPPGFVTLHSGLKQRSIDEQIGELAIVDRGGRWRLADIRLLEPDPLHTAVADLYPKENPRRLLHLALGRGDIEPLRKWARERLDLLDATSVRDLLAIVAPGALGREIGVLFAEACLAVLDVGCARQAINAISGKQADTFRKWLDAIDDPSDRRPELPESAALEYAPRAVAETAILVYNDDRRHGGDRLEKARSLIEQARDRLPPLLRRRLEIEFAWAADDASFDQPEWRRRVAGDHPVLRATLAHRHARQLSDRDRPRASRRLFELLVDDRMGPGILGMIEHDLGSVALDEGRSRDGDAHQLRAYRLLQAAGFEHVTQRVLYNLAVGDLDQLELRRAEDRFRALGKGQPDDPWILGELSRLALAKGELAEFRRLLDEFAARVDEEDPRFAEALRLLRGVAAVFNGELARAHGLLKGGGQEGEAWVGLVETIAGRETGSWQADGWGVAIAAELLADAWNGVGGAGALQITSRMTKPSAFGLALAEYCGRTRLTIPETTRAQAMRVLREGGMVGWAEVLTLGTGGDRGIVEALAEIVERAGPDELESRQIEHLLSALGLSGLELRDAGSNEILWGVGGGPPGTAIRRGRIVVVPLGGEAQDDAKWRLLTGILEIFAPASATKDELEVEETGFLGISRAARRVRKELLELGPSHLPILLVGETGVGKEVAARALHRLSRRPGTFVPVNIAAIPSNLLEAELFGSVKGAFTGADRSRQGLAVTADRGTLFLDEVGDLDPPLQVKLLRFLEGQEVRAVGATHPQKVDVRIISATHQDLARRVREGAFRQDLYFRIAAPELTIPPLRERREDISLLRDLFEKEAIARHGVRAGTWSRETEAMLRKYSWPGNVRELRHAIEVALVRASGGVIRPDHLPIAETENVSSGTWEDAQRDFRRKFLSAALERNNGNRSATARELGISRQALLYHLRNLGISRKADR